MDKSDMTLVIPDVALGLFRNDPREVMNSLKSKSDIIKFKDVFAEETTKK